MLASVDSLATEAGRRIAAEVRGGGAITFCDFMQRALYAPGGGYYAGPRSPWSEAADYVTAPQVHDAVGVAVARLVREADHALGAPSPLDVVEMGGGDGALLADLCDTLHDEERELYGRLRIWSVERGAASREMQRRRLAAHAARITWSDDLEAVAAAAWRGVVFSNELLDAFPVHRVVRRDGGLRELWVDIEEDRLVARPGPLSTPRLAEHMEFNRIVLAEGQEAEICLEVDDWLDAIAAALAAGFLLTIDYGADTAALYAPERARGSLVCQHRYRLYDDPFRRIGEQDITAHVDFGNLRRRGAACGLSTIGECSLGVFLVGFGASEAAGMPAAGSSREDVQRYLGLRHLLFSEIGAAHRALLQAKGVAAIPFGRERLS